MTWENVAPVLVTALGIAGALTALMWTLGRIFRPWMRNEAQAAATQVSKRVDALADKLTTNDFPHMERRIAEVRAEMGGRLGDVGGRLDQVQAEMGSRLDQVRAEMGGRLDQVRVEMGGRLDQVQAEMGGRLDQVRAEMGGRLDRAREDRAAMEARLLAAIQAIQGRDGPEQGDVPGSH